MYHLQLDRQIERYNRTILAELRKYVADHHRNWDLYTDELNYVYNRQLHTSILVAPFEVVLSKPTGTLALKPILTSKEQQGVFKQKWKLWF